MMLWRLLILWLLLGISMLGVYTERLFPSLNRFSAGRIRPRRTIYYTRSPGGRAIGICPCR
jgi:hypothetical protein